MTFTPRPFALAAIALASIFLCACSDKSQAAKAPPPPDVGISVVQRKSVPIYGNWVTSLEGYVTANIQPQVSGYLVRQTYREGSLVHQGDVLFEIDPRPFQAALDQALGQLSQAKGQLGQAEAQLGLAQINVKRDTPLAEAHALARSQLDNDIQTEKQNESLVQSSKASIEAAEAAVENTRLNLGFTKVRSLVTGIAGIAATQIGNLVSTSSVLTTVSQVDPIKTYFSISEQEYLALADRIKTSYTVDLLRRKAAVPLQLTLANGNIYPAAGSRSLRGSPSESSNGLHPDCGSFRKPRKYPAPRPVRPHSRDDCHQPECDSGSAARDF